MSAVIREEFEARVGVIEREVEGEKMLTRHVLEQSRRNSDDLAAIKTRLDRVEGKVDALQTTVSGLQGTVGGLQATVNGLIRDLPKIVADAVREASPGRDGKR
jgi:tetrahydromethanopterin S-methyltransferase subunit G